MEISSNDPRPQAIGADSKRCPVLSLSLDDEDRSIQWDLLIEARRGEEGFASVGIVRTKPVGSGPHNRIILQACVIGALEWEVTCTPVTGSLQFGADIRSHLGLAVEECCPSTPGLFPSADFTERS